MAMGFLRYVSQAWPTILQRSAEHLGIALTAVLIAMLIAVPLGIFLSRFERLAPPVLGASNIIMTIPSLAFLALFMPVMGLGKPPAIAALTLYAIMPIMRNTYTGIRKVDAAVIEAGIGMGMTGRQLLFRVELPIALAVLLAGLRTTLVIIIGWTTLAAFVGGGGLGQLIWSGINSFNTNMILAGALPSAVLALSADVMLGALENRLTPRGLRKP